MLQLGLRRLQQREAAASAAAAAAESADAATFHALRTSKSQPGGLQGCKLMAGLVLCAVVDELSLFARWFTGAAADRPPTWEQLRHLGAGFWLRDHQLLAGMAERMAKQQFATRRNADDCALLYCALGKRSVLQVRQPQRPAAHHAAGCMPGCSFPAQSGRAARALQGLYRSTQNRKLSEFLARDFDQELHRQAAQVRAPSAQSRRPCTCRMG